jgi:hypothetical protein
MEAAQSSIIKGITYRESDSAHTVNYNNAFLFFAVLLTLSDDTSLREREQIREEKKLQLSPIYREIYIERF